MEPGLSPSVLWWQRSVPANTARNLHVKHERSSACHQYVTKLSQRRGKTMSVSPPDGPRPQVSILCQTLPSPGEPSTHQPIQPLKMCHEPLMFGEAELQTFPKTQGIVSLTGAPNTPILLVTQLLHPSCLLTTSPHLRRGPDLPLTVPHLVRGPVSLLPVTKT